MPLEKNTDKLVIVALDEQLIQAMKIGWLLSDEELDNTLSLQTPMDQSVLNMLKDGSLSFNSSLKHKTASRHIPSILKHPFTFPSIIMGLSTQL